MISGKYRSERQAAAFRAQQEKNTKHGKYGTKEYLAWRNMRLRCHSPKNIDFHLYGARGIKVCERWRHSFPNFLSDMGISPPRTSLDRINNDGDYEPGNCRWTDNSTQSRNRRSNRIVTFNGVSMPLISLCEAKGISYMTVFARLKSGWTLDDAVTRPIRRWPDCAG